MITNLKQILSKPKILIVLLMVATILLAVGLVMPLMTISTLVFMRNSFSIVSGIYDLFLEGKYFLFIVLTIFSIVIPVLKLGFLYALLLGRISHSKNTSQYIKYLHDYGRWSMLDVLVVAILIVSVKLGAMVSVTIHNGLYVFSASVLLIMVITHLASSIKPVQGD